MSHVDVFLKKCMYTFSLVDWFIALHFIMIKTIYHSLPRIPRFTEYVCENGVEKQVFGKRTRNAMVCLPFHYLVLELEVQTIYRCCLWYHIFAKLLCSFYFIDLVRPHIGQRNRERWLHWKRKGTRRPNKINGKSSQEILGPKKTPGFWSLIFLGL